MFKLIENEKEFLLLPKSNPFSLRILSCYKLYKNTLDNLVWSDGSCFIALSAGLIVVSGEPENLGEFKEFLNFIPSENILSDFSIVNSLGYEVIEKGKILTKELSGDKAEVKGQFDFKLKELYELFTGAGLKLEFEGFTLEASKALRTGIGEFSEIKDSGELISAALALYVSHNDGIISLVASKEKRKGNGSLAVKKLEEKLKGRTAFVFREEHRNIEFYEKLGYKEWGDFAVSKIMR